MPIHGEMKVAVQKLVASYIVKSFATFWASVSALSNVEVSSD